VESREEQKRVYTSFRFCIF